MPLILEYKSKILNIYISKGGYSEGTTTIQIDFSKSNRKMYIEGNEHYHVGIVLNEGNFILSPEDESEIEWQGSFM